MSEGNRPFANTKDIDRDVIIMKQRSVRSHLRGPFSYQLVLSFLFEWWHNVLLQQDSIIILLSKPLVFRPCPSPPSSLGYLIISSEYCLNLTRIPPEVKQIHRYSYRRIADDISTVPGMLWKWKIGVVICNSAHALHITFQVQGDLKLHPIANTFKSPQWGTNSQ